MELLPSPAAQAHVYRRMMSANYEYVSGRKKFAENSKADLKNIC